MSLTSITFGDFLVVMRSDFDVNIYGEPYHAITLLYNVDTRQYLARYVREDAETGWKVLICPTEK